MKSGVECGSNVEYGGSHYRWVCRFFAFLLLFVLFGAVGVSATLESQGPGGCCWQQVYSGTTERLTGSADKDFYDYGYKPIQVYARVEEYWARDCGWWYVGDTKNVTINITDGTGDLVNSSSGLSTSKGQHEFEYEWGAGTDDPGLWNISVTDSDGTNTASFTVYVRGKLRVDSITFNGTPDVLEASLISATLMDNAGNLVNGSATDNNGTSVAPTVTAFVTGAGEYFEVSLSDGDNDGTWTGTTPAFAAMGDHKVKVMAGDGHQYWVDGSGSSYISVSGSFPYASVLLSFLGRLTGGLAGEIDFSSVVASLAGLGGVVAVRRRRNHG
jgi:hypothetical protein